MKLLKVTMVFKVPDSIATSFAKELVSKMHKYLAKHAVVVHAVDTEIK